MIKKGYQICTRCVMNTTDKEITFDESGVCNYCHAAEKRINPDKSKLNALVSKINKAGAGKNYNCLIGISGGMDSSTVAHHVKELGLRPLILVFDNSWNTKLANKNIKRILEKMPFDCHWVSFNEEQLRTYYELQLAFLVAGVPNAEIPTDHLLGTLLYETALKNKIKYIISGGNSVNEGTMPASWSFPSRDLYHIKVIYKKFIGKKLKGLPVMSLWKYLFCRNKMETINLLDFYDFDQEDAAFLLWEEYGWEKYHAKHCESAYTAWFQEFYLPAKFNIDKRRAHLSSLIHAGQITREEAIKELEKPFADCKNISQEIIKRFGLLPQSFDMMMGMPTKTHLEYENSQTLWRFVFRIIRWLRKYLKISL